MDIATIFEILTTPAGVLALTVVLSLLILLWISPYTYVLLWAGFGVFGNYYRFPIGYEDTITFFGFSQIFLTIGMLAKILSDHRNYVSGPFKKAFFLFLATSLITVILGEASFIQSFRGWLHYLNAFFFLLLTAKSINTEKRLNQLISIVCWTTFIFTFVGFYQYIFRIEDISEFTIKTIYDEHVFYAFRVAGVTDIPSSYGLYLTLPVVITVTFYLLPPRSPVFILLFLALLVSAMITFTRTSIFAIFVALFTISYARYPNKKLRSLFFVMGAVFIYFLTDDFLVQGALLRKWQGYSGRFDIWNTAFSTSKINLFSGNGISSGSSLTTIVSSHNIFLQFAIEIGIVGLSSFLYLLYHMLKDTLRAYKNNSLSNTVRNLALAMLSIIIAYTINGFFLSHVFFSLIPVLHFWIFLGALYSLSTKKSDSGIRIDLKHVYMSKNLKSADYTNK